MNIFCFMLVYESDEKSSIAPTLNGSITSKKLELNNQNHVQISNTLEFDEGEVLMNHQDQSISNTGSSSFLNDSTASMSEFRNFSSFTDQTTPKTLLLIIKLIVALYLIMLIIASVNLGINVTRQTQSENDVHTVRFSYDRMNWVSMNQLLVRVLLNIANKFEPENSILLENRY